MEKKENSFPNFDIKMLVFFIVIYFITIIVYYFNCFFLLFSSNLFFKNLFVFKLKYVCVCVYYILYYNICKSVEKIAFHNKEKSLGVRNKDIERVSIF